MLFEDFYEFSSLNEFFYFKKAEKKGCYRLVLYPKNKKRMEFDFYCKNEKRPDEILSDLECSCKIKKIK